MDFVVLDFHPIAEVDGCGFNKLLTFFKIIIVIRIILYNKSSLQNTKNEITNCKSGK